MSKHKAAGSVAQQTRTPGKRLGVKVADGQKVTSGSVLIRQRGSRVLPGKGVSLAKDYSIFALTEGVVKFGQKQGRKTISVVAV